MNIREQKVSMGEKTVELTLSVKDALELISRLVSAVQTRAHHPTAGEEQVVHYVDYVGQDSANGIRVVVVPS